MTSHNRNYIYFWVFVLFSTIAITMLSSCSTRKVVIDEVKKDSVSQISVKIATKEVIDIKNETDIFTEELTVTPIDTCKDIVIDGKVYKNVVLTYKKTKDKSIHTEKKIVSKIEDKQQSTKTVEKLKKKEVERTSLNWLLIVIISLIIVVWLNKQYLLSLLRRV
jgi:hypothetical protein